MGGFEGVGDIGDGRQYRVEGLVLCEIWVMGLCHVRIGKGRGLREEERYRGSLQGLAARCRFTSSQNLLLNLRP